MKILTREEVKERYKGAFIDYEARIYDKAVIHPGAIICEKAVIEEDVNINKGAIIYPEAIICEGAIIDKSSVIHNEVKIGKGARICTEVRIHYKAQIYEGAVIYRGATIGVNRKNVKENIVINGIENKGHITAYNCDDGLIINIGYNTNDFKGLPYKKIKEEIEKKYDKDHEYFSALKLIKKWYKNLKK